MNKQSLLKSGPALDGFLQEFDSCAVVPTRRLIAAYVRGQLGPLPRKSVMPMALDAGIPPRTLQELLSLHRWEEDRMTELLQQRVLRQLRGRPALAVALASSCTKRGNRTPGVERQRLPGSDRPENCVLLIHLLLRAGPLVALLDTELYLPESWAGDRARRRQAGIPPELVHRTKAQILAAMLSRARRSGLRFRQLLLDPELSRDVAALGSLETEGQGFLAEVSPGLRGWVRPGEGPCAAEQAAARAGFEPLRLDSGEWGMAACAFGADSAGRPGPVRRLAALRPQGGAPRYFLADLEGGGSLREIASLALAGDSARGAFAEARRELGMDHFEVRTHRSLRRHFVLSSLSLLFRAEEAARAQAGPAAEAR